MKDYAGFKHNGDWYKGNLHSNTTISDGLLRPEVLRIFVSSSTGTTSS